MMRPWLEARFALAARGSTPAREAVAGLTTFMAAAYIAVVVPKLLASGGMPLGAVTAATLVVLCLGSVAMGLYANLPFIVGPGLGGAAILGVTLAQAEHVPWPQGLGIAMVAGGGFLLLTLTGARQIIMRIVPAQIKLGLGASIGIFIAMLGFRDAGLVATNLKTGAMMLGDCTRPAPIMALVGLGVAMALEARRVPGAVLAGIVAAALVGVPLGLTHMPAAPLGWPPAVWPVLGRVDLAAAFSLKALPYLFAYFVAEFFSTLGTTLAVGARAGLTDAQGDLPGIQRPFLVDALAATLGPLVGIPGGTALVESAAGAQAGGRSGLSAVVAGLCFALALLAIPLAMAIPRAATAPALILVGAGMVASLRRLQGEAMEDIVPPVLMMLVTLVAGSFGTGIAAGIVLHVVAMVLAGRWRAVSPGLVLLALPLGYYLYGLATGHH